MITIWKLENESWILVEDNVEEYELLPVLENLRLDSNEYRAEIRIESTSSVLGV
jgi:hypothetical protein